MMKGMIFMVIGNFLMAYVFAHNMAVWDPVTWGQPPSSMSPMQNAFMASIFTWLGFYLPGDFGIFTWRQKSMKLFFIDTTYHFLTLLIAAMIIPNVK